jgi:hypothetical protein
MKKQTGCLGHIPAGAIGKNLADESQGCPGLLRPGIRPEKKIIILLLGPADKNTGILLAGYYYIRITFVIPESDIIFGLFLFNERCL